MNLKRCLTTTRGDGSSREGGADLARWECSISAGVSVETLRAAYRVAAEYVNAGSQQGDILQALYALDRRTASRAEDSADVKNKAMAYATELTRYPLEVVIDACKQIAREQTFFPALAEIVKACDRLMDKRRAILTAIEIAGRKAAKPEQTAGANDELATLRDDPAWIEWMRQVNDNPLTVKPWEQFQREYR